jgi:hypothetical protein
MGNGSITGRGSGVCNGANAVKSGTGMGRACRQGFGRGSGGNPAAQQTLPKTQEELLQEQKKMLQSILNVIEKQLENL